jgi:flagellar FliJ protein
MSWRQSLIRIAELEVETLQKRLKDLADRREAVFMILQSLQEEADAEAAHARRSAEAGWYMAGFRQSMKLRRAKLNSELNLIAQEEEGVRDALAVAFEAQKKYENLAETARLAAVKVDARRESAELDELALRRSGGW